MTGKKLPDSPLRSGAPNYGNARGPEATEDNEGIEEENEEDENLIKILRIYRKAICRIEDILDEMKITSAFSSDDQLVFYFKVEQRADLLFEDLKNINWCTNDDEQPLAA